MRLLLGSTWNPPAESPEPALSAAPHDLPSSRSLGSFVAFLLKGELVIRQVVRHETQPYTDDPGIAT